MSLCSLNDRRCARSTTGAALAQRPGLRSLNDRGPRHRRSLSEERSDETKRVHSAIGSGEGAYAGAMGDFTVRAARTTDVVGIRDMLEPFVQRRILLGKDLVVLYESVQQFVVAEVDGRLVGCGALHVMWEDLARCAPSS